MTVSLIAAVSDDRIIARPDGGIPWDLPRDKEHFRRYTAGAWMVLGRRTYAEMQGWFDGHHPIVVTRKPTFALQSGDHRIARSARQAIRTAASSGAKEVIVSGGAQIYDAALPFVEKLVLTRVHLEIGEGIPFPSFDEEEFELAKAKEYAADKDHDCDFTIETWKRKSPAASFELPDCGS
ncbi:MAG: dihydrofolate reductase [Verrucomicrobiota bacterium]